MTRTEERGRDILRIFFEASRWRLPYGRRRNGKQR